MVHIHGLALEGPPWAHVRVRRGAADARMHNTSQPTVVSEDPLQEVPESIQVGRWLRPETSHASTVLAAVTAATLST